MRTKLYALLSLPLFALLCMAFTQLLSTEDILKSYSSRLNTASAGEKIYVHTDKTLYLPGDDIWFAVYLVNDGTNTPSDISDIAYVELINPKGNVMATRNIAAAEGKGHGDFHLEATEAGGIYTLKAYTNWMKNFGEETFFTRQITVQRVVTPRVLMKLEFEKEAYGSGDQVRADFSIRDLKDQPLRQLTLNYSVQIGGGAFSNGSLQTDEAGRAKIMFALPPALTTHDGLLNISLDHEGFTESISRSVPIVLRQIDLQFFPEGGTFVAGLPNRVAFKALNEFGKPADVSGIIVDEEGLEVAAFESFHDGMGAVSFEPGAGRTYRARLLRPGDISAEFDLPAVEAKGTVLQIDTITETDIHAKLYSRGNASIQLVAHQADTVFFAKDIQLTAGETEVLIPTAQAYAGPALITSFDAAGMPLHERLVFINAHKKLHIELETNKESYTPGELVELKIKTSDEQGKPTPARLSLSVVNDRIVAFADDKQDHLISSLLLSSELKGDLHEPIFYFDDQEQKSGRALDYVMMTHGWRKFDRQKQEDPATPAAHQAETIDEISGTVYHDRKGEPIKADVYVVELGPERKIAQTRTDDSGKFVIKGVNPAYSLVIMASAPFRKGKDLRIAIENDIPQSLPAGYADAIVARARNESPVPTLMQAAVEEKEAEKPLAAASPAPAANIDVEMEESVALDEVVVVGYASERKSELSSAISVISADDINHLFYPDLPDALQGAVAGVKVVQNTGISGNLSALRIRCTGSISNDHPLIVVDGIPLAAAELNRTLDPLEIRHIEVLKGPSALALYGASGVNGVVVVTTDQEHPTPSRALGNNSFAQYTIRAQRFYQARTFYRPLFGKSGETAKGPQPATVFWEPDIRTGSNGEATVSFINSREVSNFRITLEGIASSGKLGHREQTLHTVLPLSVDTKIPPFVCFGDTIWVPLILKNNTDQPLSGKLRAVFPGALRSLTTLPEQLTVPANSAHTEWVQLLVKNEAGNFTFKAGFTADNYQDEQLAQVQVLPMGFPVYASLAGNEPAKEFTFDIHEPVPGSVKANLRVYTSPLQELMDGLSSIIREPHGCFEQTSSSTYPNVLALHLLQESEWQDAEPGKKAREFIKQGYERLLSFECTDGGFEWFGASPAHEGLTAYGLMEFHDMQQIYSKVDRQMIDRTAAWLLSRRNGKGQFRRNSKALDSFGGAGQAVSDAYITYAFTETGRGEEVLPEFEKAYQEAISSRDAYRMALMANAALNLGQPELSDPLIDHLLGEMGPDGTGEFRADHSMVQSYGNSLQMEIRSLLLMALLKEENVRESSILKLVQILSSGRQFGGFGSTQATILGLKALSMYARKYRRSGGEGTVELMINQKLAAREQYRDQSMAAVNMTDLEAHFSSGKQNLSIRISGPANPPPYTLDVSWTSATPASSAGCQLAIQTHLNTNRIRLGETIRMDVELKNKTAQVLPMSMAIVGIPAGTSPQPWQLRELQERRVFDFYEIRDNYLVLYYREIAPHTVHTVKLDLKSESPGTFQAPASSAYLYYTPEDKHWVAGERIVIARSDR